MRFLVQALHNPIEVILEKLKQKGDRNVNFISHYYKAYLCMHNCACIKFSELSDIMESDVCLYVDCVIPCSYGLKREKVR